MVFGWRGHRQRVPNSDMVAAPCVADRASLENGPRSVCVGAKHWTARQPMCVDRLYETAGLRGIRAATDYWMRNVVWAEGAENVARFMRMRGCGRGMSCTPVR